MVTHEQILEALRGINDPEMPISIVDLGIVERICVEAAKCLDPVQRLEPAGKCASSARGATGGKPPVGAHAPGATGGLPPVSARVGESPASARAGEPPLAPAVAPEACEAAPATIRIDILPTFVGCPALPMIEQEIRKKIGAIPGVASVEVVFQFDPPWSVHRISAAGRASLSLHGVTVPESIQVFTAWLPAATVRCPFCSSESTHMESAYGPTRCRMIYYCESCKNSFEHLKRV